MKLIKTKTIRVVDNIKTGQRARGFRKKCEVSLREVARSMEISAAYLSDLELGRRAWRTSLEHKFIAAIAVVALKKGIKEDEFEGIV